MGWQSYRSVVQASTPDEAFALARDEAARLVPAWEGPDGTVLAQDGYEIAVLPGIDDLSDEERILLRMGETHARTQAFERRLAERDRVREYVRPNGRRSWIADLGDGTMVAFGWAHVG